MYSSILLFVWKIIRKKTNEFGKRRKTIKITMGRVVEKIKINDLLFQ